MHSGTMTHVYKGEAAQRVAKSLVIMKMMMRRLRVGLYYIMAVMMTMMMAKMINDGNDNDDNNDNENEDEKEIALRLWLRWKCLW